MNKTLDIPGIERVVVTEHAEIRAQQRGVRYQGIILAALHGESLKAAGGVERKTLNRKALCKLKKQGYSSSFLEPLIGTVVTTYLKYDRWVVITVRPSEKDGKKRGRHYKPDFNNRRHSSERLRWKHAFSSASFGTHRDFTLDPDQHKWVLFGGEEMNLKGCLA